MADLTLVLASRSARRRTLLAQIGVQCIIDPADIDETTMPGEDPEHYVARLALDKARAVRQRHPGCPVLGADTSVVVDRDILGKPVDEADAVAMLQRLSGRWHQVVTGYAVVSGDGEQQNVICSRVKFREISDDEAGAYWQTGEPGDKAGGYAIQGIGAMFVERIEGSYSGVVGLPLAEVGAALGQAGIANALTGATG